MTTFGRFITQSPFVRKAALTTAGLALTGGAIAAPLAADPAPKPASAATASRSAPEKELAIRYEAQPNFYFCGPAATRNALSAAGHDTDQQDLAKKLKTTEAGTNSSEDTTRALNDTLGGKYRTTEISSPEADDKQTRKLTEDIRSAIDDNRGVVANIAGTAADVDGDTHSYEGGHYVAVIGHRDEGKLAKIADSASPDKPTYWMTTADLADWIATRGYSH